MSVTLRLADPFPSTPAMCTCGHTYNQHTRHPSGAEPCRHYGCGCADFDLVLDPYEVNVTNDNFIAIMGICAITIPDSHDGLVGTWPVHQLPSIQARMQFVLDSLRELPDLDVHTSTQITIPIPGYATIIQIGRAPGYFTRRISDIVALVETAIELEIPIHFD